MGGVSETVLLLQLLPYSSRVTGAICAQTRNVFIPIIALLDILRQAVRNLSSIGVSVLLTFAHVLALRL